MKKITAYIFVLLNIFSFSFSIDPKTFASPEMVYPSNDYMYSVGNGTTEKRARDNAVSAISMNFKTKVDSVNQVIKSIGEMSENDKTVYSKKQSINSDVKIYSSAELYCVNFSESYYNKKDKKNYIIAYINRKDASKFFNMKISENMNIIDGLLANAEKEKESLYIAFNYSKARLYGEIAKGLIETAVVINPSEMDKYQSDLDKIKTIDKYFTSQKKRVSVSIRSKGKGANQLATAIAEALQNDGFIYSTSNAKYIIDASVTYEERKLEAGCFVVPSLNIKIISSSTGETVESYSKVLPRFGGYDNFAEAYQLAYIRIQQDIDENFLLSYRGM